MPRTTKRPPLVLTDEERKKLEKTARSRKKPHREVQRANIIIHYSKNMPILRISKKLNVSRPTVYNCIDKALAMGAEAALKDRSHGRFKNKITPEAMAWVVNTACKKPKDLGRPEEKWTVRGLAKYARENAPKDKHQCLSEVGKSTISRILNKHSIKPHKVRYYLENRDEQFEAKMAVVLSVYAEFKLVNSGQKDSNIVTISFDEKPGIQAVQNLAPDLLPVPGKYPTIARDHQYRRLGTVSMLSGIDLHDGHIHVQIHDRHRSSEFIMFLKSLDEYYSENTIIRLILDNHSVHSSKETMAYLATRPNRFKYVFTPKHGSWLNIIETFFSKIVMALLKDIRVDSKQELIDRIYAYIEDLNLDPVVFRWRNFNL